MNSVSVSTVVMPTPLHHGVDVDRELTIAVTSCASMGKRWLVPRATRTHRKRTDLSQSVSYNHFDLLQSIAQGTPDLYVGELIWSDCVR